MRNSDSLYRACRKTPLRAMRGFLASLLCLSGSCAGGSTYPDAFSPHLSARTRSRISLFRLKERIERGPAISSVGHRRSSLEPIFVRLQGTNDPFGLAPFAPDRLPDVLGNVPRALALGLDAQLFDPLVGQGLQGCGGIAAPIVDQQRGGGVRPKDGTVPRQRSAGAFSTRPLPRGSRCQRYTHRRGGLGDTADQTRPLSRFVAHQCPRLCDTSMRLLPWATTPVVIHWVRHEALDHLVHRLQRGQGVLRHPVVTLAFPWSSRRVCTTNWPTSVSKRVNTWRLACLPLANRWCSLTVLRIVCTCASAGLTTTARV